VMQDRGTHFDPNIVDAFLANEGQFKAVQRKRAPRPLEISTAAGIFGV
jgi:response regulator RpfG family c-di-GMP phosphodiesterase